MKLENGLKFEGRGALRLDDREAPNHLLEVHLVRKMTTADLSIAIDYERIARFCRERGIRSLALFGSVLRDDFDPARSDLDVLAEFEAGALRGVGLQYFGFAEELGAILGHRVDFCSQLHPALREHVEREAVNLYEQP